MLTPPYLGFQLLGFFAFQLLSREGAARRELAAVNELLAEIDTTQPNLSQHLAVLYRTGVLAKRKEGTQVIYRVQSEKAVALCRSVCTQIAIELDEPGGLSPAESLSPRSASHDA
jgi:ArsR family transcriptional regulator